MQYQPMSHFIGGSVFRRPKRSKSNASTQIPHRKAQSKCSEHQLVEFVLACGPCPYSRLSAQALSIREAPRRNCPQNRPPWFTRLPLLSNDLAILAPHVFSHWHRLIAGCSPLWSDVHSHDMITGELNIPHTSAFLTRSGESLSKSPSRRSAGALEGTGSIFRASLQD
ncbi:hypothetical protein BD779DRAFT_427092 [Infundibulicybe gibba]|nr:hypothetical protein BD779DRAFT_427092 [Infundibulicybe gibba]